MGQSIILQASKMDPKPFSKQAIIPAHPSMLQVPLVGPCTQPRAMSLFIPHTPYPDFFFLFFFG
ncbi:hypothetical protein BKA67DRAFT_577769 [Truncatella angustata]|uniref:Uncharacterized protein n=1 Tax=Truncatella angustata TaxID=152316 RepID=A0A9P8UD20_9PEZI|nr:uncharacterized protein BKA67DRAFT_577769 [Truncatella angustata]KAH6647528.1 hypothetical protein BKA67DRAFT_577769 [Truncatella angustata]